MERRSSVPLQASLALAEACLRGSGASALALGPAADPLRLDLPSVNGPNALTAASLRILAALYFQAELEQAGVIAVAEILAEARMQLGAIDTNAARKLDAFAQKMRSWYDRPSREMIFARVFGIGGRATRDEGSAVNHAFSQVFAAFCASVVRLSVLRDESAVRRTANDLLNNLSARQFGNTLYAGQQIENELRAAVDILGDASIGARFQARGMWDLMRKLLGDGTPDLARILSRGRTGLRILHWMSGELPELARSTPSRVLVSPGHELFALCAQWLEASGFTVPSPVPSLLERRAFAT
jgi:hypothetical protein